MSVACKNVHRQCLFLDISLPDLCPSTFFFFFFFFISCSPNIIVPFIPCTTVSIHLPVTDARLLVLLTLLEPTLYQPFHSPSPASISPAAAAAAAAAAAEALSQVDGSRHSLTEPPCPPLTPLIHLYTLYTDLERRGQIKKDRFPVSSLLLMSLLLSHLLSLFFCWLKFDFHHPSPAPSSSSSSSSSSLPPLLCLPSTNLSSLQGSLYQKSSEAKDKSDLGNSCELLFCFVFYHLFNLSLFYLLLVFHPLSCLSLSLICIGRLCTRTLQSLIVPDKSFENIE